MRSHAHTLLGGCLPDNIRRTARLTTELQPEHFTEELKRVFQLLDRYFTITGAVFTKDDFTDLLHRAKLEEAKILLYEEIYLALEQIEPQEHEWLYALSAIKDAREEQLTGEAIADAMAILVDGKKVDKDFRSGHKDAREHLYGRLSSIDQISSSAAPEGDIRHESTDIKADYAARKAGKVGVGIQTGIAPFDIATGGLQNGELIMIAAYTGQGKTNYCVQLAWHTMVMTGKNVYFATSETLRAQIRRKLIARHSRLPQFGLPSGLSSTKIKMGKLSPEEEQTFSTVVDDFTHNPRYGKLFVAQMPLGATPGYLQARLARAQQSWDIHLVIMDYIGLMQPLRFYSQKRDGKNDVIQDCKMIAATHADGRGVPFVTPWQMSQDAWKKAISSGFYVLASLADTSEAEKSADQIMAFLRFEDTPKELKAGYIKLRDSEIPPTLTLDIDYDTSFITARTTAGSINALIDDQDELDSLLS